MTLLKHALKIIRKEAAVCILTMLQLAVMVVITVVMTSSALIRYQYYEPFKDILRSNGILCDFSAPANYDEEHLQDANKYIADDELKEFIPDIKDVVSCNLGPSWLVDENNDPAVESLASVYYDDDIIERYKLDLSAGRWLNTSKNADCIEGVISENALGINVGDKVRMGFFSLKEEDAFKEVLIVGKIAEGSKIFGYGSKFGGIDETNISYFYGTPYSSVEDQAVLLLSSNYLSEHTSILQGIFGTALITFPENYPREKIERAREQLSGYNCNISFMLSDIDKNSTQYILEQITILLPIIIVLGIMIILSAVSCSVLSIRREIKDFAIFYISGLRWKQCAVINLIQAFITAVCSVTLSGIGMLILTHINCDVRLIFHWETLICAAVIVLLYICISLIMPFVMLSRTTPKQILTR